MFVEWDASFLRSYLFLERAQTFQLGLHRSATLTATGGLSWVTLAGWLTIPTSVPRGPPS